MATSIGGIYNGPFADELEEEGYLGPLVTPTQPVRFSEIRDVLISYGFDMVPTGPIYLSDLAYEAGVG